MGGPPVLHSMAVDNIFPILSPFAKLGRNGEPSRALGVTILICAVSILIANLDLIAPLITMYTLLVAVMDLIM